jgi:hypothetical protein
MHQIGANSKHALAEEHARFADDFHTTAFARVALRRVKKTQRRRCLNRAKAATVAKDFEELFPLRVLRVLRAKLFAFICAICG